MTTWSSPFLPPELAARVRGALRRSLGPSQDKRRIVPFVLGDLTLDYTRRHGQHGRPVNLTPIRMTRLLFELSVNAVAWCVSFDHLLERVWSRNG